MQKHRIVLQSQSGRVKVFVAWFYRKRAANKTWSICATGAWICNKWSTNLSQLENRTCWSSVAPTNVSPWAPPKLLVFVAHFGMQFFKDVHGNICFYVLYMHMSCFCWPQSSDKFVFGEARHGKAMCSCGRGCNNQELCLSTAMSIFYFVSTWAPFWFDVSPNSLQLWGSGSVWGRRMIAPPAFLHKHGTWWHLAIQKPSKTTGRFWKSPNTHTQWSCLHDCHNFPQSQNTLCVLRLLVAP